MCYHGISFHKRYRRWVAYVYYNNKQYHAGSYSTAIHAAVGYNLKVIELCVNRELNTLPPVIPPICYRKKYYYGVMRQNKQYKAYIIIGGQILCLGSYATIEQAAFVYNQKAVEIDGENVRQNEISDKRIHILSPLNTSGFTGVSYHSHSKSYHAAIKRMGKTYSLGYYATPEQAALAYNQKALELDGLTAKINQLPDNIAPVSFNYRNNTSGYRGVHWNAKKQLWFAKITCFGKNYSIGYFESAQKAAFAYNQKAIELYGSNAKLNKI